MNRTTLFLSSAFLFALLFIVRMQDPQDEPPPEAFAEVPIGGIILWWGRADDIPDGFEACDGRAVSTRGAVLRGLKPDLKEKFVRGARDHRTFIPTAFRGGGSDTIEFDSILRLEDHELTREELPAHTHDVEDLSHDGTLTAHRHDVTASSVAHTHEHQLTPSPTPTVVVTAVDSSREKVTADSSGTFVVNTITPIEGTPSVGAVSDLSDFETQLGGGEGQIGDHTDIETEVSGERNISLAHDFGKTVSKEGNNIPVYLDVVFIIRVK